VISDRNPEGGNRNSEVAGVDAEDVGLSLLFFFSNQEALKRDPKKQLPSRVGEGRVEDRPLDLLGQPLF
jgi:hypothetical protein